MAPSNWPDSRLGIVLGSLAAQYGVCRPEPLNGPFEMLLWEIVAYLADDARRTRAFRELRDRVGLTPEHILGASPDTLLSICQTGGKVAPDTRADRLVEVSRLAVDEFGANLSTVLAMPADLAIKQLMRFPGTGRPGAEKILLFSGVLPVLALESNGLRVLARLGYGEESTNYSSMYMAAQGAAMAELPADCELLTRAHHLLRRHGQETCRRALPICHMCAANGLCPSSRVAQNAQAQQ